MPLGMKVFLLFAVAMFFPAIIIWLLCQDRKPRVREPYLIGTETPIDPISGKALVIFILVCSMLSACGGHGPFSPKSANAAITDSCDGPVAATGFTDNASGGSISYANGLCTLEAGGSSNSAIKRIDAALGVGSAFTVEARVQVDTALSEAFIVCQSAASPVPTLGTTVEPEWRIILLSDQAGGYQLIYWDASNTPHWYNPSTDNWVASNPSATGLGTGYYGVLLEATATQWRVILKDVDGATIETTPYVDWSGTYDSGVNLYYAYVGDRHTSGGLDGTVVLDSFTYDDGSVTWGVPTLGAVSNITPSSFRMAYTQNLAGAGVVEDKIYIHGTYFDNEATGTLYTTLDNTTAAYVDFTGLTPGRMYWVECWRYVDNVLIGKAAHSYDGFARSYAYDVHRQGITQDNIVTPVATNFTEDWSTGDLRNWTVEDFIRGWDRITISSDNVMGAYLHIGDYTRDADSTILQSSDYFKMDVPVTVSWKQRNNTPGANYHWFGFNLMSSEAEYAGMMNGTGGIRPYTNRYEYFNSDIVALNDNIVWGTAYDYRMEYTPSDNTIKYYIDNVLRSTRVIPGAFTNPKALWLGFGGQGSVDIGTVTVTGDRELFGFSDVSKAVLWNLDNACMEGGTESSGAQDNTFNYHYNAGGITAMNIYDNLICRQQGVSYAPACVAKAVSFAATSPRVAKPSGRRYNTLKLIGSVRSGGTLKVYVYRDNDTLVPDSEIPDNSAGFTPTYGNITSVDMRGVTASPIYFKVTGSNPTDSLAQSCPDTGAPVLKSLFVDFTSSRLNRYVPTTR